FLPDPSFRIGRARLRRRIRDRHARNACSDRGVRDEGTRWPAARSRDGGIARRPLRLSLRASPARGFCAAPRYRRTLRDFRFGDVPHAKPRLVRARFRYGAGLIEGGLPCTIALETPVNTPAHAALNFLVLGRRPASPRAWIVFAAVLPDLPMFAFFLFEAHVRHEPIERIFREIYFQPGWQALFDAFHSIPIFLLLGAWFV